MRGMLFMLLLLISPFGVAASETEPPRVSAETEPVRREAFRVVHVVDPRLPRATDSVIHEALRIAANWIEVWYQKRVRFKVDRTEQIDSYLAAHLESAPILEQWKQYPYALDGTDSVRRFLPQQTTILQNQSIPVLKSYVPASIRARITTPEAAAGNLLDLYDEKLRLWKSLRSASGLAYFDTGHAQKHSYWFWERTFESVRPDRVSDHLIITNVMLLDDALSDAPPHSLLRGGLLNGMAMEESPQALVSTFPILTDAPGVADLRDTSEFTSRGRILALAHIIAHEFGAHVIQGYKDVYDHPACLAVPTSGLAYQTTLDRLLGGGPPCKLDHPRLSRRTKLVDRYENLARRYLEGGRYVEAKAAVESALEIDPSRQLLKLMHRQLTAKVNQK